VNFIFSFSHSCQFYSYL